MDWRLSVDPTAARNAMDLETRSTFHLRGKENQEILLALRSSSATLLNLAGLLPCSCRPLPGGNAGPSRFRGRASHDGSAQDAGLVSFVLPSPPPATLA